MIASAGRLEDAERDKIEEQVGLYVRSSTENIRKLEASINLVKGLSPQSVAHRHGVVRVSWDIWDASSVHERPSEPFSSSPRSDLQL